MHNSITHSNQGFFLFVFFLQRQCSIGISTYIGLDNLRLKSKSDQYQERGQEMHVNHVHDQNPNKYQGHQLPNPEQYDQVLDGKMKTSLSKIQSMYWPDKNA